MKKEFVDSPCPTNTDNSSGDTLTPDSTNVDKVLKDLFLADYMTNPVSDKHALRGSSPRHHMPMNSNPDDAKQNIQVNGMENSPQSHQPLVFPKNTYPQTSAPNLEHCRKNTPQEETKATKLPMSGVKEYDLNKSTEKEQDDLSSVFTGLDISGIDVIGE
eukprot:2906012-Ditylum_brightwellii.AAC.1